MVVTPVPNSQTETYLKPRPSDRRFRSWGPLDRLKRALLIAAYVPGAMFGRWFLRTTRLHGQARTITVARRDIALPNLSTAFDGLTVAFLTDLHCSPETPPAFLERVVAQANQLKPDLILLGGDYVTEGTEFISSVGKILARLQAPLGVLGVLGNHDFDADAPAVRAALKRAGVVELTNSGRWLTRGDSRLRIAGIGDLWCDVQDVNAALAGVQPNETAILISHNPDYAMELTDPRVGLVLSGHTHGGQINLPRIGSLITNSRFGRRFTSGLIPFPSFQLYISRGIGSVMVPFRYYCPPEITFITLRAE